MSEQQDARDSEDLERAYRAALALPADAQEQAGHARRKRALLAALDAEPVKPAQTERAASLGAWWRGAAAASVLVASSLLVLHLRDEPEASVQAPERAAEGAPQSAPAPRPDLAPAPESAPPAAAPQAAQQPAPAASPRPRAVAAAGPAPEQARMTAPHSDKAQAPAMPAMPAVAAAPAMPAMPEAAAAAPMPAAPPALVTHSQTLRAEPAAPVGITAAGKVMAAPPAALQARKTAPERSPGPAAPPPGGLLEAVMKGNIAAVERLLAEIGPDDELDGEGRTPLSVAVVRADIPMIKLLLARGARPDLPDRNGETAKDRAFSSSNKAVRQIFGLQ